MLDAVVHSTDTPSKALAVYRIIFTVFALIGLGKVCCFLGKILPQIEIVWVKRILCALGCSMMLTVVINSYQLDLSRPLYVLGAESMLSLSPQKVHLQCSDEA